MAPQTVDSRRAARIGQHGITLIEASIVLAIAAIIASTALPSFQALIEARRLAGVAAELASDVHFVRSAAVARDRTLRLSFHAGAEFSCYVIHTGSAAQCACTGSGPAQCSGDAVELKTVTLPAGGVSVQANVGSIVFDPVHGTSTPTATLRIADAHGHAVHHVLNIMGRIRSCTPQATVPGYRVC